MKRLLPLAVASLVALGGCCRGTRRARQPGPHGRLRGLQDVRLLQPSGHRPVGYQSVVSQHLKTAAQRELEARGLRLVTEAPQLLVNFSANLTDKLHVGRTSTMGAGIGWGCYGYRAGMYGAWPMYADPTVVTQYKEGTLNIDVVDGTAGNWCGKAWSRTA